MTRGLNMLGTTIVVSDEESECLNACMRALEELAAAPFAHDRKPWEAPHPAHFTTPAKMRATIAEHLAPCRADRRAIFTAKLVGALTVNGVPFLDVERGASVTVGQRSGVRSRVATLDASRYLDELGKGRS